MTYETRKPTGLPSWPILLLAGGEKAGKTYAAAEASGSELIDRTFWITVGEDQPDEYGAIEGARFEIVKHDGTYRSILGAIQWASAQPATSNRPHLIVLDSGGRMWALLSDAAQETANERARRKRKTVGDDGADITMDLWNTAKQRWGHILDALRDHNGPSIITARLEETTVVENGQPTKDKTWKVQAEKNLPYDVGACVHLRTFGDVWLTGVRSLRFKPKPNEYTKLTDFTVDGLWRSLGLADTATSVREHASAVPQGEEAERVALLQAVQAAATAAGVPLNHVATEWASSHDGQPIGEATDLGSLELLRDDLIARGKRIPEPSGADAPNTPAAAGEEQPSAPEPPPQTSGAEDAPDAPVPQSAERTDSSAPESPLLNTSSGLARRMFALFGEISLREKADRLAYVTDVIGRSVKSSTEMTDAEAEKVIAAIERDLADGSPAS